MMIDTGILCQFNYGTERIEKRERTSYIATSSMFQEKEPNKKPRKDENNIEKVLCNACGRHEGHTFETCRLKGFHPDVNTDANIKFADSEVGKKWKLKGTDKVPFRKDLQGNPVLVPEDIFSKPSGSSSSSSSSSASAHTGNSSKYTYTNVCVCHEVLNCNINIVNDNLNANNETDTKYTYTCYIVHREVGKTIPEEKLKLEALLDTGALSSNYISVNYFNINLKNNDKYFCYDTLLKDTKVCTAFNDVCNDTFGNINCFVSILNELTNNYETYSLSFKIIDIKFDMIIGLKTIKLYNLLQKCKSLFTNDSYSNVGNSDILHDDEMDILSEVNTSSQASVEGGTVHPTFNVYDVWDTCCSTEEENTIVYKHIHDIIGKNDDLDQLTIEKMSKNDIDLPWDSLNDPNLTFEVEDDSCLPTNVSWLCLENIDKYFGEQSAIYQLISHQCRSL
jgi:hypothetical protein